MIMYADYFKGPADVRLVRKINRLIKKRKPLPRMIVMSNGSGVQSTTIILLAIEGKIPKPDLAIFADTGWEPRAIYDHLCRLEGVARVAGIETVRVSSGDLRADALDTERHRFASMPLYTRYQGDAKVGMLRRQCTREYKLEPIYREVRRRGITRKDPAAMWIGISTDEATRMRPSRVQYVVNTYPLIDLGWSRGRCREYLKATGWDVPKSSCIGCPFHDNHYWRRMKENATEDWKNAVEFDEAIRNRVGDAPAFLHRSGYPLAEANLGEDQLDLFSIAECEGMCGV